MGLIKRAYVYQLIEKDIVSNPYWNDAILLCLCSPKCKCIVVNVNKMFGNFKLGSRWFKEKSKEAKP